MCLGIPGKITALQHDRGLLMGTVDFGGITRDVCLAYLEGQVAAGDYVIVHVGFAISKVDEAEAKRTYQALEELAQLDELDWLRETAQRGLAQ